MVVDGQGVVSTIKSELPLLNPVCNATAYAAKKRTNSLILFATPSETWGSRRQSLALCRPSSSPLAANPKIEIEQKKRRN